MTLDTKATTQVGVYSKVVPPSAMTDWNGLDYVQPAGDHSGMECVTVSRGSLLPLYAVCLVAAISVC